VNAKRTRDRGAGESWGEERVEVLTTAAAVESSETSAGICVCSYW
jgi:hypothetical protein